jgi:hypothetical protein
MSAPRYLLKTVSCILPFVLCAGVASAQVCTSFSSPGQNILISNEATFVTWSISTTPVSCAWAATGSPLIQTISPESGTGASNITATFLPNNTTTVLTDTVTLTSGSVTYTLYVTRNPSSCNFTYSQASLSFPAAGGTQQLSVSSNWSTCIWYLQTSQPWLTGPTQLLTGSQIVNITASANTGSARAGTLNTYGALSNPAFPVAQAGATDNLSASPSTVPLSNGSGAGIVTGSSTLSNTGGAATTFTISSTTVTGGNWLNASATTNTISAGGSVPITIAADTSQLIPGSYTGTVTIRGTFSMCTITVNLTVNGVQISVSPNPISLGSVQPQKQPATTVTVTATGTAVVAIGVAISPGEGSGWLTVDVAQITASSSATFHVTVNASSLPPGNYLGTVSLQCTAAPCIEVFVPVTFTIPGADNLGASPSTVPLSNGSGAGIVTGSSTLSNTGTAGTAFTISSTTLAGGNWLSASAPTNTIGVGGSVPITIAADTSQLIPGSYTGTVAIRGAFSVATITVNMAVSGVTLSVSPNPFSLGTIQQQKSSTLVTVTSSGTVVVAIQAAISPGNGSGWLTTDAMTLTVNASATFHVTVDASSLPPGNYMGAVSLQCQTVHCIEAFVPVTFSVATGLSFVGSMPHIAAEENWTTAFTLVNKGTTSAQTTLDLFGDATDPTGNGPLALPLAFPQLPSSPPLVTTSLNQTIAGNATFIVDTSGPQTPPVLQGSAQLSANGAVDGFAIFHQIPTAQEAVVPMETRNASSYLMAFDNTNGLVLGVAVENVSTQSASIPVIIRDDTGAVIGPEGGTISLPGNGHMAFVLSDPLSGFPVTLNKRGTVEFDTPAGGQISVLGIRFTPPNNALTTIPALANVGTIGGSIAHLATGNGWQTTFVLVNTGTTAAQVNLNFFADVTGAALPLPISFPQSGTGTTSVASSVSQTLPAGASLLVLSDAPASNPTPTTGSAQLSTNGNVSGFVIFRYNPNGQEAVVPLESRVANGFLIAFDNTASTATGIAVNSVSSQTVSIPVIVRDDAGNQLTTDTLNLNANGHLAFTLGSSQTGYKYPQTANIRGTIEFDTPTGGQISALGIRIPLAHTFTTLPALAK